MNNNHIDTKLAAFAAFLFLSGCQSMPQKEVQTIDSIQKALASAEPSEAHAVTTPPPAVQRALLPPAAATLAKVKPAIPSFDVSVNAAPARQFFMSLVEGTPDNMVVHPEVDGLLTLDLKDVTTEEVLATVRDVYGYEYRYSHGVYQVFPARMRSQIFKVDYLDIQRHGGSRTRVSSGQVSQADSGGSNKGNTTTPGGTVLPATVPGATNTGNSGNQTSFSGAQVTTRSEADFWEDLEYTLKIIVGEENGRRVVTNPLSGTVLVRAMPRELLDIEQYLQTLENAVSRQVIIEAKIIEVQLNDAFQTGVNWNAIIESGSRSIKIGQVGGSSVFENGLSELAGTSVPINNLGLTNSADAFGGVFALQAHIGDFNTLIELLKTQGDVQVLSSPRVSTVNNQKAIIKVGTDEYFVTDLDVDTDTTSDVVNQSADVTLTPFFSGVALDVTPQIDDNGAITLHVHPAISEVTEDIKDIGISSTSRFNIPLATSTIRESDTIVRAQNGQVVVIGGLMQDLVRDDVASTPFFGDIPVVGNMFRHTRKVSTKTELVILLRPVVVDSNAVWKREIRQASERFRSLTHPSIP